jgi:hypothetical protein
MLNHVRSWLIIGWFKILCDFVGLSELYGLKYDNLITSVIIFCTCALIIWIVPLHWLVVVVVSIERGFARVEVGILGEGFVFTWL